MRKKASKNERKSRIENIEEIDNSKLEKIDEEIKKNKITKKNKTKKEKTQKKKRIVINLMVMILVSIYLLLIILGTQKIPEDEIISDLINFSYFFLVIAIIVFEIAFKKDSFEIALYGVESVILAGITVYILDLYQKHNDNLMNYIIYGILAFVVYYIIKIIVILIKKKKK